MILLKLDFVYLRSAIHFKHLKHLKIGMRFQMTKQIHLLPTCLRWWGDHPKYSCLYLVPFHKKRRALCSQCEHSFGGTKDLVKWWLFCPA